MFEAVLHDQDLGYSKEKKMKATLHNILEVADDIIKRDVPYKNYGYQSGKVYYESEEGELDAIQQFVEKGTRDGLQ